MDAATREEVQGDCGWLVVAGASRNDNGPCEEDSPVVHHEFLGATLAPKLNKSRVPTPSSRQTSVPAWWRS
jgi:hypothetical protein